MTKQILDCNSDTRKLYQIVSNITGIISDNPMPEGKTDQELADSFANFFNNKILKMKGITGTVNYAVYIYVKLQKLHFFIYFLIFSYSIYFPD